MSNAAEYLPIGPSITPKGKTVQSAPPPAAASASAPDHAPAKGGDRVLHAYDDIQEYDNDLPRWWLFALYGTIIFAFAYYFWFQVFQAGESPGQAYHREMQSEYAAQAARLRAAGAVTPAALIALSRDDATVREGRQLFTTTCAPCHGATAGGNIGPNLTDEFWLHGGAPNLVYQTITNGVTSKGMPAWGAQLGAERVQAVTAYLLTLRNTNIAGGKAPQGNREP